MQTEYKFREYILIIFMQSQCNRRIYTAIDDKYDIKGDVGVWRMQLISHGCLTGVSQSENAGIHSGNIYGRTLK